MTAFFRWIGLAAFLLAACSHLPGSIRGALGLSEPAVALDEEFEDNRHGWLIEETENTASEILSGAYEITKKSRRGISLRCIECGPDQGGDFLVEAVLTKVEGENDYGYGLVWGTTSSRDTYKFLITGDGYYFYGRQHYDEWKGMDSFQPCKAVHQGDATNKLTLKKQGRTLLLLVNDQLVHTAPFEAFSPNNVGFTLEDRMRVRVQSLVIRNKRD